MIPTRLYHSAADQFREEWAVPFDCAAPSITVAAGSSGDPDPRPDTTTDFVLCVAQHDGDWAEQDAIILARMEDGRWYCVEMGCDTTGWDCQSGGSGTIADSWDDLVQFGLSESVREALPWIDYGAHVDDTLRARTILPDQPLVAVFTCGAPDRRRVVIGGEGHEVRVIDCDAADLDEELGAFARAA